HVVLVDVDLDAEAPTHVGRDDTHALLGEREQLGQHRLHHVRDLRGDPERQRARGRLVVDHEAPRLDGYAGVPPDPEFPRVHAVGRGERAVRVARGEARLIDQVVAELRVNEGRIRGERRLGVEDGGERRVLDGDALRGVLGGRRGQGGDGDDRLADVADALHSERQHRGRLTAFVVEEHAEIWLAVAGRGGTVEHADDVGGAPGRVDVHTRQVR